MPFTSSLTDAFPLSYSSASLTEDSVTVSGAISLRCIVPSGLICSEGRVVMVIVVVTVKQEKTIGRAKAWIEGEETTRFITEVV